MLGDLSRYKMHDTLVFVGVDLIVMIIHVSIIIHVGVSNCVTVSQPLHYPNLKIEKLFFVLKIAWGVIYPNLSSFCAHSF